jgi:hypothetical protein
MALSVPDLRALPYARGRGHEGGEGREGNTAGKGIERVFHCVGLLKS